MARTIKDLNRLVERHNDCVMFVLPMEDGCTCGTLLRFNSALGEYEVDEYTRIQGIWCCDMFCQSYCRDELEDAATDHPEVLTADFEPSDGLKFQ